MQFLITSFNKKDGIKTNKMFYLTRPLLLGDFRKSSPVPFTGFAEVLHARQCSNAFVIALA